MILSALKFIRDLLEQIISERPLIWFLVFATLCISHIPLAHILNPGMYTNVRHSATFIPDWHLFNNMLLVAHIAAALPATLLGPLMFISAYRKAYPAHHRFIGKVYVIGCLISAVTVFPLAVNNAFAWISQLGFSVMAVVWFLITWLAYCAARRKDFVAHRRWMMRTYAMTFAFVHVNFTFKHIGIYYLDTTTIKVMQSMGSWMFNLLFVEFYLAATAVNGRWLGWRKWLYNLTHWAPQDKFYWTTKRPEKKEILTAS